MGSLRNVDFNLSFTRSDGVNFEAEKIEYKITMEKNKGFLKTVVGSEFNCDFHGRYYMVLVVKVASDSDFSSFFEADLTIKRNSPFYRDEYPS